MRDAITLGAAGPDEWRLWRKLRLQALAESPHAFGTKLHEWLNKGDTEARWRKPAGMVSATAPDQNRAVELISMWVAPSARGRGVGDALVQAVIRWSNEQNVRYVAADVKEDNLHAIALYARHGFAFLEDRTANEPGERTMIRAIEAPQWSSD